MYNKLEIKNSRGFTLIEVITSITLLSIVIAILLPMFPQVMRWSNQADVELVSSNLLDQLVLDLKKDEELLTFLINNPDVATCENGFTNYPLDASFQHQLNGETYLSTLGLCRNEQEASFGLFRGHLKILTKEDKEVADTYFYLTVASEADE